MDKSKKGKVFVYSPISLTVHRTSHFLPWYRNSLIHGLIFLGRMQRIFCSYSHAAIFLLSFHQVPITAGWTEALCGMQGFCPITPLLVLPVVLEDATRRRHHHSICTSDAICEHPRNYLLTTREPIPRRLTHCQTWSDALTIAPQAPNIIKTVNII